MFALTSWVHLGKENFGIMLLSLFFHDNFSKVSFTKNKEGKGVHPGVEEEYLCSLTYTYKQ